MSYNNDKHDDEAPRSSTSSDLKDPQEEGARTQRLSGWRLFVVQFVLCLGLLLSVMESSIVATALVTIGDEFKDFGKSIWAVLSYLLTYMGLAIVFARLSDVTGRRTAVLSAWVIFTIFSLACGFASSLDQLIAFRALQGIGGSGLYTLTMVVIPELCPQELFAIMSGAAGATFACSAVLGPVLGGVITTQSTWRWIFWLNAPLGLVAFVLLLISWPRNSRKTSKDIKLAHVDWLGATLILAASVLLVFGLEQAGSAVFAWNSATSIVVLTVSGVCWLAFAVWITWLYRRHEAGRGQVEGIFPLPVILRGKMIVVIITTFCTGFSFLLVLIYLPQRYQVIQLKSPVQAGVSILPMLCSSAFGSLAGAGASLRQNNTFYTLVLGNALLLAGCGLLSTAQVTLTIPAREYGYQVLIGTGVGMVYSTATIMCALTVRFRDLAVAQGVLNQARVLAGSLSLTVATIVFNSIAVSQLSTLLTPSELSELQKNPVAAYSFTLDKQVAVREVFAVSWTSQLRICTYVMAASFVISLFAYTRTPPNVLTRKANHDAYLDGRPYTEDS